MILADGAVVDNALRLSLTLEDKYLLDRLKSNMESENKVSIYERKNGGKDLAYTAFCSKKLINDLKRWGVVPNKSHTEFHIPDINPELIRHFIRGYFDGNGTVFLQSKSQSVRIGFYSNETLLKDIQLQLNKSIKTPINKIYKKVGCYLLSYARKDDIYHFYHYLYDDADIYMKRKKDKFDNYM